MGTGVSGLTRRALLGGALAAGAVVPLLAAGAANGARRRLIVVWAQGGWDVTYVYDPKLGVPGIEGPEYFADGSDPDDVDHVRTFGDLRVMLNEARRPSVTRFFERHAAQTAIVNGVWVGSIAHDPCRIRMLTGSTLQTASDLVVISGAQHGVDLPLGSIDMSGVGFSGPLAASAGSIGNSSQIKTLLDPTESFEAVTSSGLQYPQFLPSLADEARIRERQIARHAGLAKRYADGGASDRRLADFLLSIERAERFGDQAQGIVDRLTLGTTPSFNLMLDLATDLVAEDVCAAVMVDTRVQWDTHVNNESQNGNFELLFAGLDLLADYLEAKGLAESTTVVVLSEMTRSPRHNLEYGKDHWQHTSTMLFGANVRPGLYGATDDLLESIPMDLATGEPAPSAGELCKYDNFVAGVLAMMDVDPARYLPDATPFLGASAG